MKTSHVISEQNLREGESRARGVRRPGPAALAALVLVLLALRAPPAPGAEAPTNSVERPRTLAEALRQRNQQAGSDLSRRGAEPQSKARTAAPAPSSVEAYDKHFASLIRQRWIELLHNSNGIHPAGKLVLEFELYPDGTIDGMRVADGTAGKMFGLLCQGAVLDPAPYPAWPGAVREQFGEGPRPVTMVFVHAAGDLSGPPFELRRRQDRLLCELRHNHPPMEVTTTAQAAGGPSRGLWAPRDSSWMESSGQEDYRHWKRDLPRQWEKIQCPKLDFPNCPVSMPATPK